MLQVTYILQAEKASKLDLNPRTNQCLRSGGLNSNEINESVIDIVFPSLYTFIFPSMLPSNLFGHINDDF